MYIFKAFNNSKALKETYVHIFFFPGAISQFQHQEVGLPNPLAGCLNASWWSFSSRKEV